VLFSWAVCLLGVLLNHTVLTISLSPSLSLSPSVCVVLKSNVDEEHRRKKLSLFLSDILRVGGVRVRLSRSYKELTVVTLTFALSQGREEKEKEREREGGALLHFGIR
jgi:hypothetical protein